MIKRRERGVWKGERTGMEEATMRGKKERKRQAWRSTAPLDQEREGIRWQGARKKVREDGMIWAIDVELVYGLEGRAVVETDSDGRFVCVQRM